MPPVLTYLYSDDFVSGTTSTDPPWTTYIDHIVNVPSYQVPQLNYVTHGTSGSRCVEGKLVASAQTEIDSRYAMWNTGSLDTSADGVFTELVFDDYLPGTNPSGLGQVIGGLAIGVSDPETTTKYVWNFRSSAIIPGSGFIAGVYSITRFAGTAVNSGTMTGSAYQPASGDVCRLQLRPTPGLKIEAFINNVMIGSMDATLPTGAKPKSIGYFIAADHAAWVYADSKIYFRNWKGGSVTLPAPVPVFTIELDPPVKHTLKMQNLIADFGDGFEQRRNNDLAYARADGEGGVTSYKGRNRFEITMDMLRHVNGDATQMANKLWNFYKARTGSYEAFYFYNPAEAITPDPTGASTTGRYLVRFEQPDLTREHFVLFLFKSGISMIEVRG